MEVENLNLDDFDINEFEPPHFNIQEHFEPVSNEEDLTYEDDEHYVSDESIESIEDNGSESEESEYSENDIDDNELEIQIDDDEDANLDLDENFDNVIYSYPFYSKNDIDYEYRVTISEEELLVEQVKCDDSKTDYEKR